jgi:hypothetical protein
VSLGMYQWLLGGLAVRPTPLIYHGGLVPPPPVSKQCGIPRSSKNAKFVFLSALVSWNARLVPALETSPSAVPL